MHSTFVDILVDARLKLNVDKISRKRLMYAQIRPVSMVC